MAHEMNKLGFGAEARHLGVRALHRVPSLTRPLAVGAASLTIAGLLGACASPPAASSPGPSPVNGPQARNNGDKTGLLVSLKNAESAFTDYAHSLRRESALRQNVEAASNAALVARHRQSIGVPDFSSVAEAERRLAVARGQLRAGESATRVARARLYRVLGLEDSTAMRAVESGGDAAPLPAVEPRAQPFTPGATL